MFRVIQETIERSILNLRKMDKIKNKDIAAVIQRSRMLVILYNGINLLTQDIWKEQKQTNEKKFYEWRPYGYLGKKENRKQGGRMRSVIGQGFYG